MAADDTFPASIPWAQARDWQRLAAGSQERPQPDHHLIEAFIFFLLTGLSFVGGLLGAASLVIAEDLERPLLAWSVCLGVVALVPAFFGRLGWRRWSHTRRTREGQKAWLAVLGKEGAEELSGGAGVAEWLETHWTGQYPRHGLLTASGMVRASVNVDGAPVLVDATVSQLRIGMGDSGSNQHWTRVALARRLPPGWEPTPELLFALGEVSYQVAVEPAGLLAWESDASAATLEDRARASLLVAKALAEEARRAQGTIDDLAHT